MKISVILPCYNNAKYLNEALTSVLQQSYADFELIIIEDGSTDNSREIIKGFTDPRIKLLEHKTNLGIVISLNEGIKIAQGEYIARMDADDVMLPGRLGRQAEFLDQNPKVAVVGSYAETIDENNNFLGYYDYPPLNDKAIRRMLLTHNPFIHPSTMLRRNLLLASGGYKNNFNHIEDYELWTRLLQFGQGANLPERLIKYRLNQGGTTSKKRFKMRVLGLLIKILALKRIFLSKKR